MNGATAVLRCGQCNKPFDKQSSLKRHGYYCRSRTGDRTPRLRSCAVCVKGKTRCDAGRPACSRCRAKGIACHYPLGTAAARGAMANMAQDGIGPVQQQDSTASNNMMLNTMPTAIVNDPFDWAGPNFEFADLSEASSTQPFTTSLAGQIFGAPQATDVMPLTLTVSPVPPLLYSARSMIPRQTRSPGAQRTVNLIFHTLRSYSVMMLRHKTLPPFIHPLVLSSSDSCRTGEIEPGSMETLSNCMNLINMISTSMQGSRKLFWRNVKQECERLCLEYKSLTNWELLSAMHALSLYTLIRLHEGEKDYNNIDFLLLSAVILVGQHVDVTCRNFGPFRVKPCWENWIYEESRRRLAVLYRTLNVLIYFEPAEMCTLQSDLVMAPLPARKRLWEAGNPLAWKEEMAKDQGVQSEYGLTANGDLVRMYASQDYCNGESRLMYETIDERSMAPSSSHKSSDVWEDWCSGMDEFGGLVMLAAVVLT